MSFIRHRGETGYAWIVTDHGVCRFHVRPAGEGETAGRDSGPFRSISSPRSLTISSRSNRLNRRRPSQIANSFKFLVILRPLVVLGVVELSCQFDDEVLELLVGIRLAIVSVPELPELVLVRQGGKRSRNSFGKRSCSAIRPPPLDQKYAISPGHTHRGCPEKGRRTSPSGRKIFYWTGGFNGEKGVLFSAASCVESQKPKHFHHRNSARQGRRP